MDYWKYSRLVCGCVSWALMRLSSLFVILMLARPLGAQTGATVSGVVRDSIAGIPIVGASVQLVGAERGGQLVRSAVSDGNGRFQLNDVPNGRYKVGFFHSRLDSLGLEPVLREITVSDQRPVQADLATPSAPQLRTALCGVSSDSGAVVIGVVRDALNRSTFADAAVNVEWFEYGLNRDGIALNVLSAKAMTRPNGWFVLCGLPRAGTIVLAASRGADSTDRVEVDLPTDRFLRRDLYLGAARVVQSEDTTIIGDSSIRSTRITRLGDGRLTGRVVTSLGDRALAGAQVGLVGGPQTRANDRGEWTLANAAPGTRSLEVRAVGYYPERRSVDIVADAEPIYVSMRTMKSVLDTVRIVEARLSNKNFVEFERRQRSGAGNYVTMADIERRNPFSTSDIFKFTPGVRLQNIGGAPRVYVRGLISGWCAPGVFIDGLDVGPIDGGELDTFVNPNEIAGVEIYSGTNVPFQFISMRGSSRDRCGAIVIWTKMRPSSKNAWTARNAFFTVGFIGLSLLTGVLFTNR